MASNSFKNVLRPLSQPNNEYTTNSSMVEQPAQDRLSEFINNLQRQQEAAVNAKAIEKLLERFDQMMSVMTTML